MSRINKKISMYGYGSGPLESFYESETLDYIDPEFIDSDEMQKEDVIMESVMNPNRGRKSEILGIMAEANIGSVQFIKNAQELDVLGVSGKLGSRISFNIITRVPDLRFGTGQPISGINVPSELIPFKEFSISDCIADIETEMKKSAATDRSVLHAQLNSLGMNSIHNFAEFSPHGMLYCLIKAEEKAGKNIFSCDGGNALYNHVISTPNKIRSNIDEFEDFIITNGILSASILGAFQIPRASGIRRSIINSVISLFPGVNSVADFYRKYIFGGKLMSMGYEYCMNEMCENINDYSVIQNKFIKADTEGAFREFGKGMGAAIRKSLRTIGGIISDVKSEYELGTEELREQLMPSAGLLDYDKMDELAVGTDYEEVKIPIKLSSNSGDENVYYFIEGGSSKIQDKDDLVRYFKNKNQSVTCFDSLDVITYTGDMEDPTNLYAVFDVLKTEALSGDSTVESFNLQGSPVSMISSNSKRSIEIPTQVFIRKLRTVGLESGVRIRPVFKISQKSDISSSVNTYEVVQNIAAIMIDGKPGFQGVSAGSEMHIFHEGKYSNTAQVWGSDNDVLIVKLRDTVTSENTPDIYVIDDPIELKHQFNYIYKKALNKYSNDTTIVAAISSYINSNQNLNDFFGIPEIDMATTFIAFKLAMIENGVIGEKKMDRKVDRRVRFENFVDKFK